MQLSWIAETLGQTWSGPDCEVNGCSIDTRSLQKGDLFVAFSGLNVDGHAFLENAAAQGAVAALVEKPCANPLPQITVKNTNDALLVLAKAWRLRFSSPCVAVTGSCGKTSTRALLQSIFSCCGETLASERSFNNAIGVPLTVLRLQDKHKYAVFEIGANHPGEISVLTDLVKPQVALITLAALSHLSGFGSLEGIARAKGEIFQGLATNGVGIVNQDDQFADYWSRLIAPKPVLRFALHNKRADVTTSALSFDENAYAKFNLHTPQGSAPIHLQLMGEHNVMNALAAASAAVALSVPLESIQQGLQKALAEKGRLRRVVGQNNACIIDDSYNANPASVKAAIDVLVKSPGVSILVLGDMLELGKEAEALHAEVGAYAKKAGVHYLLTYGSLSQKAAQAFGEGAEHMDEQPALIRAVQILLAPDVTVLVKGSNSMGMCHVAEGLL